MVEIRVLAGKKAGESWNTRRFPVRIGRSSESDLCLDEPGIWDDHAELTLRKGDGFLITALAQAVLTVNGQCVPEWALRNGDVIDLGSARLQFWLSRSRQKAYWWREVQFWGGLTGLCGAEAALIYLLNF